MSAQSIAVADRKTVKRDPDPRLEPGEVALVIPSDLSAVSLDLLPGDSLIFTAKGNVAGYTRPSHDREARRKYALALEETEPWYRVYEDGADGVRVFLPTEYAPKSVAHTPALLELLPRAPRPFPAQLEWDDDRAEGGRLRCIMTRAGRELDDARAVALVIEMRERGGIVHEGRPLLAYPNQWITAYIDVPQWWLDWARAKDEALRAAAAPTARPTRRRKSPSDRVRGGVCTPGRKAGVAGTCGGLRVA